MKKNWINGKTVIISGSSSGIGKEITKILIQKYNCVVIGIARSEERCKILKEELGEKSDNFSYQLFDVSKRENWISFSKYLDENEIQPEILINNAGILPKFNKFENYELKEVENVMNINFYSCVFSIQEIFPKIKKSKTPCLINISSSAALETLAGTSIYSASKSALKCLTESMQAEEKRKSYVSLVCPGLTTTGIFQNQENICNDKRIKILSMPSVKMAKKIVKGMKKRKKRMVLGFDAKFMDFIYRFSPRLAMSFCNWCLKTSKIKIYKDVFSD